MPLVRLKLRLRKARRGDVVSFRYYLYISDTKVDMLLSQIDRRFARKHAAEWGVGLKVFSAKRTVETREPDQVARLERVMRHLDDFGDVGSVDEPGQFFRGTLGMQWGTAPTENGSQVVYFGGRSERMTIGLGGSTVHVLGGWAVPASAPASDGAPPRQTLGRRLFPRYCRALRKPSPRARRARSPRCGRRTRGCGGLFSSWSSSPSGCCAGPALIPNSTQVRSGTFCWAVRCTSHSSTEAAVDARESDLGVARTE